MKTEQYKKPQNLPVAKAISYMINCWYNFMQEFFDGVVTLNCKAHKIAILHKKNRFGRYVKGPDRDHIVERYYIFMERLSHNPWSQCKTLLMKKMHTFVVAVKQVLGAVKFTKQLWSVDRISDK